MKKRIVPVVLALLLLFGLTACSQPATTEPEAPVADAPAKAEASLAQQLSAFFASGAADEELSAVLAAEPRVVGINARINGETSLLLTEPTDLLAQAVLPEGMVVDHWEINGVTVDSAGRRFTLEFTADGPTFVAAVLRPELKVTSINATMQFLNENGKPAGPVFDEFVFEEDYINEATGEMHPRGTITVNVKADVPEGFVVDYWLINDVPYFFNNTVTSFNVIDLDETTVYEIVLRAKDDEPTDPASLLCGGGTTPVIEGDVPYAPPAGEDAPDATPAPDGNVEDSPEATPAPNGGEDPFGVEEEETPEPTASGDKPVATPKPKPSKPSNPKPVVTPKPEATSKPAPTPAFPEFNAPPPSSDDEPGDSGSSDYSGGDSGSSDYSGGDSGSSDYSPNQRPVEVPEGFLPVN